MAAPLLKIGKVEQVEDSSTKNGSNGLRIKVRFPHDKEEANNKFLPWTWPLLPKMIQTAPKVGEAVLVINVDPSFPESQRFYIGPIISQPQKQHKDEAMDASTMLLGSMHEPLAAIANNPDTKGSFPEQSDVALVGRKSEDIILRDDEISIRAGIRQKPTLSRDINEQGYIIFNDTNPAYIQLKYNNSGSFYGGTNNVANPKGKQIDSGNDMGFYRSSVNIVADKINLISNKDDSSTVTDNIHGREELISDKDLPKIIENLHRLPLGDRLVYLLKVMRGALLNHVHPWAGMKQCGDWAGWINLLEKYDIDDILSDHVRIS